MVCLTLVTVMGCEADSFINRDSTVYFAFSYSDYPTSQLFVAAQNPGSYAFVWTRGDGKSTPRHVYVQINDGKTPLEDNIITNAILNNLRYLLGSYNEIGLIVGCTNHNGRWAYDRCCPNCTVYRALQWTGNRQKVVCNECHRVYDLETSDIIEGDQGASLRRYYCTYNGVLLEVKN